MHLVVEFDGGSRGNPGPAGFGVVVRAADDESVVLVTAGRFLGTATNNIAEYKGLLHGLERAAGLGATSVTVRGDSELVIRQMKGQYKVRNAGLLPLFQQARRLAEGFGGVTYEHRLRDANKLADKLANLAMDRKAAVDSVD